MLGMRPSGAEAVAERDTWQTYSDCRKARDRLILALSKQKKTSKQIAAVLNIHPASVRRIRARINRKLREKAAHAPSP